LGLNIAMMKDGFTMKKILIFLFFFALIACSEKTDKNEEEFNPIIFNKSYTPLFTEESCYAFQTLPPGFDVDKERARNNFPF